MRFSQEGRALGTAVAVAMAVAVWLWGPATRAQEIVLRSADTHADGYPTVEAVEHMAELVHERTDGRILIQVFPGRQLGEERDTIEQTIIGAIDLNRVNLAPLNNIVPETAVPGLPFLFRSIEHMRAVVDGPIGDEILAAMEPHGMIGLAFYDSGARSFYNTVRPIRAPDDMEGLRIRVQNSDLFVAMVEALGANATPMEFGQVYDAIRTGVIDGAENNWPSYESTRHFEVAQHYTLDQHSMSPEVLVASKTSWERLAPEDREIIRQAARESVPVMRALWDERVASAQATVTAAGNEIIEDVDKEPFIEAMQPVYDRFVTDATLRDLVERIRAVEG